MRNLQETLAQIRTWSVMGGDVAALLTALKPARAFPRTYFFDLWIGEVLAQGAARRTLEHITQELVTRTDPGDLVITHGPPAQDVAFLCAQHRRRVLLVVPSDQSEAVKRALKTLAWTSMPALIEKPKAPPPPLTAEEIANLDPRRMAIYEEAKRMADKTPRPVADQWNCDVCGAAGPTLTTSPTLERHRELCPGPKKTRVLVDEPERAPVEGAIVTRMEGKLFGPGPQKVSVEIRPPGTVERIENVGFTNDGETPAP